MADIQWTVSGGVFVHDFLTAWRLPFSPPEAADTGTPGPNAPRALAGIEIRLSAAREGRNNFRTWATFFSERNGGFSLRTRQRNEPHRLRIEIRLNNDDLGLTIKQPTHVDMTRGPRWITIFEDSQAIAESQRHLGFITFRADERRDELRNTDNRVRAILWVAARALIQRLRDEDEWLTFGGKLHVMWPAKVLTNASWAEELGRRRVHLDESDILGRDPTTRQIFPPEERGGQLILTLFHEMMHIWNYDHNYGTTNWLQAFCSQRVGWDTDTMSTQEHIYIAFHEGFAEFAAWEIWSELFGVAKPIPYRRAYLRQGDGVWVHNLLEAERSWRAVASCLRMLCAPDLFRLRFGAADDPVDVVIVPNRWATRSPLQARGCPRAPNMRIWDILRIFRGQPGTDFPHDWQVGRRNWGLMRFLDRTQALSDRLDEDTKNLIRDLLDSHSTREPQSLCGQRPPRRNPGGSGRAASPPPPARQPARSVKPRKKPRTLRTR